MGIPVKPLGSLGRRESEFLFLLSLPPSPAALRSSLQAVSLVQLRMEEVPNLSEMDRGGNPMNLRNGANT